jgi:hypothetical protein
MRTVAYMLILGNLVFAIAAIAHAVTGRGLGRKPEDGPLDERQRNVFLIGGLGGLVVALLLIGMIVSAD